MTLLNLAGPSFDFGDVVFAVIQECEHRRRSFPASTAREELMALATTKLDEIHESYVEADGSEPYWTALEKEVLETVMPRYVDAAVEHTRLEKTHYDVWRGGDVAARAIFAVVALTIGGIIVAAPFIPIFIDAFAFILASCAWFYPELRQFTFEYRHSKLLNQLVAESAKYQANYSIQYVTVEKLDRAFSTSRTLARGSGIESPLIASPREQSANGNLPELPELGESDESNSSSTQH